MSDCKIILTIAVYKTQIVVNDYLGLHKTMNKEKFKEFHENKVKPAVQRLRIGQPCMIWIGLGFLVLHIAQI